MKAASYKAPRPFASALAATLTLLLAGAASAGSDLSQAQRQYQRERAVCLSGESNQARATCLQEAGAALGEARRNNLAPANTREMGNNRMIRCDALPVADREDCAKRMQGEGVTSGSAQQGGVLRELTRPIAPGQ